MDQASHSQPGARKMSRTQASSQESGQEEEGGKSPLEGESLA